MKRGGPIVRRTVMKRTAFARTAPREPGRIPNPPKPRKAKRRGLRRPSMDGDLRAAVYTRSGGLCDRCGHGIHAEAWECHHRKLRSRGGEDSHENLIALCPGCHQWAHQNPAAATDRGFIVPSYANPVTVPVWRHGIAWWIATPGRWRLHDLDPDADA